MYSITEANQDQATPGSDITRLEKLLGLQTLQLLPWIVLLLKWHETETLSDAIGNTK